MASSTACRFFPRACWADACMLQIQHLTSVPFRRGSARWHWAPKESHQFHDIWLDRFRLWMGFKPISLLVRSCCRILPFVPFASTDCVLKNNCYHRSRQWNAACWMASFLHLAALPQAPEVARQGACTEVNFQALMQVSSIRSAGKLLATDFGTWQRNTVVLEVFIFMSNVQRVSNTCFCLFCQMICFRWSMQNECEKRCPKKSVFPCPTSIQDSSMVSFLLKRACSFNQILTPHSWNYLQRNKETKIKQTQPLYSTQLFLATCIKVIVIASPHRRVQGTQELAQSPDGQHCVLQRWRWNNWTLYNCNLKLFGGSSWTALPIFRAWPANKSWQTRASADTSARHPAPSRIPEQVCQERDTQCHQMQDARQPLRPLMGVFVAPVQATRLPRTPERHHTMPLSHRNWSPQAEDHAASANEKQRSRVAPRFHASLPGQKAEAEEVHHWSQSQNPRFFEDWLASDVCMSAVWHQKRWNRC